MQTDKKLAREIYGGFFRGVVLNNNDPDQLCRLQVNVPELFGSNASTKTCPWAVACLPYGGGGSSNTSGFGLVAIPPVGSSVFVSFEHGQLDKPIWVGCPYLTQGVAATSTSKIPPPKGTPVTVVSEVPEQVTGVDGDTQASYPNNVLFRPVATSNSSPFIAFSQNPQSKSCKVDVALNNDSGLKQITSYNPSSHTYSNTLSLEANVNAKSQNGSPDSIPSSSSASVNTTTGSAFPSNTTGFGSTTFNNTTGFGSSTFGGTQSVGGSAASNITSVLQIGGQNVTSPTTGGVTYSGGPSLGGIVSTPNTPSSNSSPTLTADSGYSMITITTTYDGATSTTTSTISILSSGDLSIQTAGKLTLAGSSVVLSGKHTGQSYD